MSALEALRSVGRGLRMLVAVLLIAAGLLALPAASALATAAGVYNSPAAAVGRSPAPGPNA